MSISYGDLGATAFAIVLAAMTAPALAQDDPPVTCEVRQTYQGKPLHAAVAPALPTAQSLWWASAADRPRLWPTASSSH